MKQFTPVQVIGTSLDKMYIGCLGIVLEEQGTKSLVGFYYPDTPGKNAFVKKVSMHNDDLAEIGKLKINPKP